MPYNIRIVSTYPPRTCGIGTFSRDLANALEHFTGEVGNVRIAAIDNGNGPYHIPVDLTIDQYNPESWHYAIRDIIARAIGRTVSESGRSDLKEKRRSNVRLRNT